MSRGMVDVAVAGGGVVGAAAALALARLGLSVAMVEGRAPSPWSETTPDLRVFAFAHDNAALVVFPVDRFLHLHRQLHGTRGGWGNALIPFAEDIAILRAILRRNAGQSSNIGDS